MSLHERHTRDYRDLVIEDLAADLHDALLDRESLRVVLSESMTMVARLTITVHRQRDVITALRTSVKPPADQAAA